MKQERQEENTATYVERMRRRGIFRSLKIVDIKLPGAMFSWYMNRIA